MIETRAGAGITVNGAARGEGGLKRGVVSLVSRWIASTLEGVI